MSVFRKAGYVLLCLLFAFPVSRLTAQNELWRSISGEYYDWTKEGVPEQSYNYEYHQTLVMHMFMAMSDENGESEVRYTFEEALSLIKQVDAITRNIPKIIYIVGWQYRGHDDLYPAWHEVNPALKRQCDGSGRESLIWLYEEAKKYNTTVSLHVNMTDAYEDSPLWDEYLSKGLISRKADGTPMQIGVWNGRKAYQICYKDEWEQGFATKRIDELLELLPFLKEAGTILCDAFFSRPNPYLGISQKEEESYQRRIIRYFKSKGIDVAQESFNRLREGKDLFVGLSPWFVWLDFAQDDFMKYPSGLVSGDGPYPFVKQFPELAHEQMQLGFLFGMSTRGEDCFGDMENALRPNKDWETKFRPQFYTGTLAYMYLNKFKREKLVGEGRDRVAHYNDGLVVSLKDSLVTHGSMVLREGNDMFFPIDWNPHREIIAYSGKGYTNKEWKLPDDWSDVMEVAVYEIKNHGLLITGKEMVKGGKISLSLAPGQAVSVCPVGARIK